MHKHKNLQLKSTPCCLLASSTRSRSILRLTLANADLAPRAKKKMTEQSQFVQLQNPESHIRTIRGSGTTRRSPCQHRFFVVAVLKL